MTTTSNLPKCPKHPKYQAKRPPRTCECCWDIYNLRRTIDSLHAIVQTLYEEAFKFFLKHGVETYVSRTTIKQFKRDVKALSLAGEGAPHQWQNP